MIEGGYDEDNDLYYIIMEKLDEDLNQKIEKCEGGRVNLQTTVNIGL